MPIRPLTPCRWPGCPVLSRGRFCEDHANAVRRAEDRKRGNSAQRLYDAKWRKARLQFLIANPLCVQCRAAGRVTAATVVDHIVPHRGDKARFWDRANWQALCKPHHDSKTAIEDGGWGRPPKGEGGVNL